MHTDSHIKQWTFTGGEKMKAEILNTENNKRERITHFKFEIFPVFLEDNIEARSGAYFVKKIHSQRCSRRYTGISAFDNDYDINIKAAIGNKHLLFYDGTEKEIGNCEIILVLRGLFTGNNRIYLNFPGGINVYVYTINKFIYAIILTRIRENDIETPWSNKIIDLRQTESYFDTNSMLLQAKIKEAIAKFLFNGKKAYIKPTIKRIAIYSPNACFFGLGK